MRGDLGSPLSARLEGFFGICGDLVGEPGLLLNVSTLGIGVLEGRGPGSIARIGNGFATSIGDWTEMGGWVSMRLSPVCECFADPMLIG